MIKPNKTKLLQYRTPNEDDISALALRISSSISKGYYGFHSESEIKIMVNEIVHEDLYPSIKNDYYDVCQKYDIYLFEDCATQEIGYAICTENLIVPELIEIFMLEVYSNQKAWVYGKSIVQIIESIYKEKKDAIYAKCMAPAIDMIELLKSEKYYLLQDITKYYKSYYKIF